MTKPSIGLQDLRRRIYLKAKADQKGFGWKRWSRQKLYDRLGLNTGSSICRKRSRFERPHNP